MNNKEQHIRDLLRRWTTGEITAREEAELLAAAQQDPFLQEALAAYQGQSEHDHAATLARIRRETSQRLPIRRNIGRWMAIAASMLLLVTVGWWTLKQQSSLDMAAPVAMEKPVSEQSAPAIEQANDLTATTVTEEKEEEVNPPMPASAPIAGNLKEHTPVVEESTTFNEPSASYAAEEQSAARAAKDREEQLERQRAEERQIFRVDTDAIAAKSRDAAEADEQISAPPAPPTAPASSSAYPTQNPAYARRLDDPMQISNAGVPVPANGYRIIEGYVTDAEGYPLIGANVMTPGSANGTVTDLDGFYQISVAKEVKTLSISYTGFESTQVNIANQDKVDVALAEGMALDEVVVTGLSSAKKRQQTSGYGGIAQPIGGFASLRDYLVSNTPTNTPRARIKVRFLVQADGRLTDFTILKSTNIGQNSLAIQLLQQGPKWEVTEGNAPVETDYIVRF
jgi:hypothetical protein